MTLPPANAFSSLPFSSILSLSHPKACRELFSKDIDCHAAPCLHWPPFSPFLILSLPFSPQSMQRIVLEGYWLACCTLPHLQYNGTHCTMLIPLIQSNESDWLKIPEIVEKQFSDGDLQEGFVLIQNCGEIDFELKTQKIECTSQNFQSSGNEGAYWYRSGVNHSYCNNKF